MIDSSMLFPYKTFTELIVRPEHVDIILRNGKSVSVRARPAVATQPNEYHLYTEDDLKGWRGVRLSVRVFAQESALEALVPSGTSLRGNTEMILVANCLATKVRRRVFLSKDPDRTGEWSGQFDLDSSDLSDSVELAPLFARTTRYPNDATDTEEFPLATFQGAILGFGEPITIFVDPRKDERGGNLRVTWENFSQSSHDWRKTHCSEMFYIDTQEAKPEVYLNADHDLLKQTLMKRRPRGAEASIKASIIAYIAHTTWSTLFLSAMADCVDGDDDEASWPADEVKKKIIKKLLPSLIPERSDDEERLRLATALFKDPSRFGSLLTKMHSAIQGLIKIDDFVVKTLEATGGEEAR